MLISEVMATAVPLYNPCIIYGRQYITIGYSDCQTPHSCYTIVLEL